MQDRYIIFLLAMALTLLGVIMVFSTTGVYAETEYKNCFFFLRKEILWISIGLLALLFGYNINLKTLEWLAPYLFVTTLFLVCLTHTPLGVKIGGAHRWIRLGFFNFQPSEFLKFGLICMLASYLSNNRNIIKEFWKGLAFCLMLIGLSIAPVLTQPDFGTSFMLGSVGLIIMFIAGAKMRYLWGVFVASIPFLYYFIVNYPYRMRRVVAFLNPWEDPLGNGFQIVQSFLAIANGKLTGVGLGESTQKLFYLPAAHTDFIFSILAEELGFIGSVSVISAFIILAVFSYTVAIRAKSVFSSYIAIGCTSYITLQAIFNIAVVTGSVPTKGIPLPFISFGGSSLILNLFAIGIIMNVSKQRDVLIQESESNSKFIRTRNTPFEIQRSQRRHLPVAQGSLLK